MQPWSQFYATIGAAPAQLLGLLFVAVSVNAWAALGPDQAASRRLTEQAFQNYLAVMSLSLLALFPGITTETFGVVTLIVTDELGTIRRDKVLPSHHTRFGATGEDGRYPAALYRP